MTELALFGTDLFGEVIKGKQAARWRNALRCPPFTIGCAHPEGRNGSAHGRRWGFAARLGVATVLTYTGARKVFRPTIG